MVTDSIPADLDPRNWLTLTRAASPADVEAALNGQSPGERELAVLLSPAADARLESLARRAQDLTRAHFGRAIQLYVPLYLSNYCSGGCAYCGYAADRRVRRHALSPADAETEMAALADLGFEEILLLTGERCPQADLDYLETCVRLAARYFHLVTVEVFPMQQAEYAVLARAGCTGLTLYQETYEPEHYRRMHRWGSKADYAARLQAPERALAGGLRTVGLGALLGLGDPCYDLLALYRHVRRLQRRYWRAGVSVSFPRLRPEAGGFQPTHRIDDRFLARAIWAFRLVLPDVPLVLSTRERSAFRDGMAGVGINKMSIGSRTTVGGYRHTAADGDTGQFQVSDDRDLDTFRTMLRERNLDPVFKNWDATFRMPGQAPET